MKKTRIVILVVLLVIAAVLGVLYLKSELDHKKDLARYPVHYREIIKNAAEEFGLDPYMVISVTRIESFFDPNAVSSVGAVGLMQIMPETGEWIAHKLGLDAVYTEQSLYDPETNIRIGCWYLSFMSQRFEGNETAVICGYNAGHGTLERWLANPDYVENGQLTTIPNADVSSYLEKYRTAYGKYKQLYPNLFEETKTA